ncbi:PVC-type heme-binding CxxCH protein [Fibrella aquatilis]|uniref:HEAT repeat domain-containing protein n=1 Tax=Fibrella aquatilis TaxID=2817059 RepID=A0A939K305_9BACT|nr:PVC-type heme-binding CxxCH protein [Fibrella aquatilis]MBO0933865.1 HEAT repeat domain-containing protein [Fibrella aquatilis]
MKTFAAIVLLLGMVGMAAQGQSVMPPFTPKAGNRIVLLGNTFADRMRHYGYLETLLQQTFPNRQLSLRNMGWSADEVDLQPRPLNFPGFGEQATRPVANETNEVVFNGFTRQSDPITMPVALNFAGLNQDLTDQKADILFLCFGMNEAFGGAAGLRQFEQNLGAFVANLQRNRYNGRTAPVLVLVSPIAHEEVGPRPVGPLLRRTGSVGATVSQFAEHNQNLALYTNAMRQLATAKGLYFIDLFTPSLAHMQQTGTPITINGIHLTDEGYRLAAGWMGQALGLSNAIDLRSDFSRVIRRVIKHKDDHFFYRWRAVNGEYIYGRRREPFGVIAFPPELRKLAQMVAALDSVIWDMGSSRDTTLLRRATAIVDRRGKPVDPALLLTVPMLGRQGKAAREAAHQHQHGNGNAHEWPATTDSFKLPDGYAINLFASEKDFPVQKPVALNFDARGRLWVATMPTYPQYFPGIPVHDKIVILEDTDHDGKADKHTVFADDLYLPLGFEFGAGGIYVSQEPDLLFLKDTDGDDKADVREMVLSGFGSEDSHHAIHAFTYGPDGALYLNEGTFLNSQIETPYGPVRSYAGTTYRFEPRTAKLSAYVSYPYYNPWGNVFTPWGTHLIGDASDGSNYFAPPMTGRVEYPAKHPRINTFTETRVRPTAGIELISSRQFPAGVQGNFLVNNNIGFQGIKQHRIVPNGSGIGSREVEPLLQSTDLNFRPIDLKFGPDGALYVVDWYNPLISHGENPPRDSARDTAHGRIWRITYTKQPLLPVVDLSRQSVPQLLDHLKAHESRLRYRARAQLRAQDPAAVLPQLTTWLAGLDKTDSLYEQHLLEGLWLHQDFDVPNEPLLKTLLTARAEQARAAATTVLLHWRNRVPDALSLLHQSVNDPSPRVRLEAVVALSFYASRQAVQLATEVLNHPTDYYLDYALGETFSALKPVWLADLRLGQPPPSAVAHAYLLRLTTTPELGQLPPAPPVWTEQIIRADIGTVQRRETIRLLAKTQNIAEAAVLLGAIKQADVQRTGPVRPSAQPDLIRLLLATKPAELRPLIPECLTLIRQDTAQRVRATAMATIITAEQSDKTVWPVAKAGAPGLSDYLTALSLLPAGPLKASFYGRVKPVAPQVPGLAYPLLMAMKPTTSAKLNTLNEYIGTLSRTPDEEQRSPTFARLVEQAKSLVAVVPKPARPALRARLDRIGRLELTIRAVEAKMAFDKTSLVVPAGKPVSLVFENPDLMPHNLVFVKPGSAERVGTAADAMATLPDGFEKNFVPVSPDVLFATPLVNPGKSFRLTFTAPAEPGEYPFLCSFPGHWRVMQGILVVKPATAR